MNNDKKLIIDIIEEEIATIRSAWVFGRTRNSGNKKPRDQLNNNEELKNIFLNLKK